ncbi:MAG: hypothetical protein AAFR57_00820 [Pseudomonadota bacterium]
MRTSLATLVAVGLLAAGPVLGQEDRAARVALAEEYIALAVEDITVEQFSGSTADGVVDQLRGLNADLSGDKEARVRTLFGTELAEIMRDVMSDQAQVAADIYTLEELTLLKDLYTSPIGRSVLAKNAEFVRAYQPQVVEEMRSRMPRLNAEILEIVGDE